MNTTRFLQWTFAVLVLTVVVGYNGCGETGFNAVYMSDMASISGVKSQCDAQLMQVYSKTYFPLLSTNCNRCHSDAHGSTNISVSFQAFMLKGKSLIDYQATHPHGDNGVNLTSQIAAIQSDWSAGQSAYTTCLASAPMDGGSGGSASDVRLADKVITGITDTIAKNGTFKTISWDVSMETANASQQGMVNAVLTLDVRYALQGTVPVGLEFKNPRMHLKAAGDPVVVSGLSLYLDKAFQDRVTIYTTVSATVSSTTDVQLAPGFANALVYYPQVTANTLVSFDIGLNGGTSGGGSTSPTDPTDPTTPTSVTFTQLVSNDATLGVFKKSCLGCHSGAGASGGVDLTDYSMAKKNASDIQSRMSNSGSPMPPQGILGQGDRDTVNKWISGGTPQ
jgi:hypothetical protein